MKPSKDMIDFVSSRDARSFTNAVNNILNTKAAQAVDSIRPKVASDMFKAGYYPKSGDEQKFVDKHKFDVIDYPVNNEHGLPFREDSAPHRTAKENNRANYDRCEDEKVYEENSENAETIQERKLTASEKSKREEIASAIEKDNPKMSMSKKMAIATTQAKKYA